MGIINSAITRIDISRGAACKNRTNHAYPVETGWRFGVSSAENCRLSGVGGLQRLFEGAETHTNLAEANEPVLTG
jgi:hypothetical protein